MTFGRRGTTMTIGAPGTGVSYSQNVSSSRRPAVLFLLFLLALLFAWLF